MAMKKENFGLRARSLLENKVLNVVDTGKLTEDDVSMLCLVNPYNIKMDSGGVTYTKPCQTQYTQDTHIICSLWIDQNCPFIPMSDSEAYSTILHKE